MPSSIAAAARHTIAAALAPPGTGRTALLKRLKAESVLRYGRDGTYDGATVAFDPVLARATPARAMAARQQARGNLRDGGGEPG